MIQITNLSKRFNSFTAIENITLSINDGEIFGIVGESGAGKTTLLRCITSLEKPDTGSIDMDDEHLSATVFQNYNLLSNKTIFNNVALPLKLKKQYSSTQVMEALEFVNLLDKKDTYPSQLSGGERQRVAIARAIVSKPKYLIFDEPTSALDHNTTQDMIKLLKRIHDELQTTIIIVTHELLVAKELCTRVAILDRGKLIDVINVTNNTSNIADKSYLEHVMEVLL